MLQPARPEVRYRRELASGACRLTAVLARSLTARVAIAAHGRDRAVACRGARPQGGHDVPEDVVRRRFISGRENFETLYKLIVDKWLLYDNSGQEPVLLDSGVTP